MAQMAALVLVGGASFGLIVDMARGAPVSGPVCHAVGRFLRLHR